MAKKVQAVVKLQLPAAKATPAPPVGTALGPQGVSIMDFVQAVQCQDRQRAGRHDHSGAGDDLQRSQLHFHHQDAAGFELLKRAAGIVKGSAEPNRTKVGKVTRKQVEDIAKIKLVDLNTTSLESAVRTVTGTARNMGLEVEG